MGWRRAPRIDTMIRRIDLRGRTAAPVDYRSVVPRSEFAVEAATHVVRPICDDVRDRGVEAIAEYSAKFDAVEQSQHPVSPARPNTALADRAPRGRARLEE